MNYHVARMQPDGSFSSVRMKDAFTTGTYVSIGMMLHHQCTPEWGNEPGTAVRVTEVFLDDPAWERLKDASYKYYIRSESGKWIKITKDEVEVIGLLRKK